MSQPAAEVDRRRSEHSKLRRELGRVDAICFLIAAIVVLDTLGAVARGGAQTFLWLAFVSALFLVPAGLADLPSSGPRSRAEGGHYVWTRLAFGRVAGAVSSPSLLDRDAVWIGGSLAITAIAAVDRLVAPGDAAWRLAFVFTFIWLTIALASAPLHIGKWIPATCAVVQVALLAFFTLTVGIYAAEHGVHGVETGDLAPSWAVFIVAALPVLALQLHRLRVPSTAAEEMRDPQRDIPTPSPGRARYVRPLLHPDPGDVLVLPPGDITSLTGFIAALARACSSSTAPPPTRSGRSPPRCSSGCSSRTGSRG